MGTHIDSIVVGEADDIAYVIQVGPDEQQYATPLAILYRSGQLLEAVHDLAPRPVDPMLFLDASADQEASLSLTTTTQQRKAATNECT